MLTAEIKVKNQVGGRNYLLLFAEKQSNSLIPIPFISVTNRYGIPIFFINAVENRKNTPLIFTPKNQWVEPKYFLHL